MIKPTPEFWKIFKETNGALSCAEAVAIMNLAAQAPEGVYIELGTHKGKSAMAACVSLKEFSGCEKNPTFYLVDPIFEEVELCKETHRSIGSATDWKNMIYCFENTYSIDEIPKHDDYAYVMVDSGSHGDGLPMQEAKLLEDRMAKGGIMAWHDYKNQFVEVEAAYNYLLSTGKFEEVQINWQEIFDYVAEHNLEEGNNSWHLYPELPHPPNFVGALKRK